MSRNKEKQHLLNALLGKGINTWKFFNEDINLQEANCLSALFRAIHKDTIIFHNLDECFWYFDNILGDYMPPESIAEDFFL